MQRPHAGGPSSFSWFARRTAARAVHGAPRAQSHVPGYGVRVAAAAAATTTAVTADTVQRLLLHEQLLPGAAAAEAPPSPPPDAGRGGHASSSSRASHTTSRSRDADTGALADLDEEEAELVNKGKRLAGGRKGARNFRLRSKLGRGIITQAQFEAGLAESERMYAEEAAQVLSQRGRGDVVLSTSTLGELLEPEPRKPRVRKKKVVDEHASGSAALGGAAVGAATEAAPRQAIAPVRKRAGRGAAAGAAGAASLPCGRGEPRARHLDGAGDGHTFGCDRSPSWARYGHSSTGGSEDEGHAWAAGSGGPARRERLVHGIRGVVREMQELVHQLERDRDRAFRFLGEPERSAYDAKLERCRAAIHRAHMTLPGQLPILPDPTPDPDAGLEDAVDLDLPQPIQSDLEPALNLDWQRASHRFPDLFISRESPTASTAFVSAGPEEFAVQRGSEASMHAAHSRSDDGEGFDEGASANADGAPALHGWGEWPPWVDGSGAVHSWQDVESGEAWRGTKVKLEGLEELLVQDWSDV